MTPYDDVAYDDRPVAEAHPQRLFESARRWGVDAAPVESARILELGCAHGAHLWPIAFRHPQAQCLGIDLSKAQIDRGQEHTRALGLRNLELRAADVTTLDVGEGGYDYVIAHGLFSWVPAPVQHAVLELCHRALAPAGVAYISYNALPGWGVRGSLRRTLLAMVEGLEDPHARIERARKGLEQLASVDPLAGTAEGALVQQEIEALAAKPDMYLLHEYLVPAASAFAVRDFVQLAGRHRLAYLDDVALLGVDDDAAVRAATETWGLDTIGAQEALDLLVVRQFRATLLVHEGVKRSATPEPVVTSQPQASPATKIPERPSVSALTRLEIRLGRYASTPSHTVAEVDAFHAALIRHLDGTLTVADLVERLVADVVAGRLQVEGGVPNATQLRAALPKMLEQALRGLAQLELLTG